MCLWKQSGVATVMDRWLGQQQLERPQREGYVLASSDCNVDVLHTEPLSRTDILASIDMDTRSPRLIQNNVEKIMKFKV